jgi:hypothetical protein
VSGQMLKATTQIVDLLGDKGNERYLPLLLTLVAQFGKVADSRALLQLFLKKNDPRLLEAIMASGDATIAEDLYHVVIANDQLKKPYGPEVLTALAYLEHPATQKILLNNYQGLFSDHRNWDLHTAVCLGLLNYELTEEKELLKAEIDKCLETHLFPDLLPVLFEKIGEEAWSRKILAHANDRVSTSCISGIILGTAMGGQKNRSLFKELIFNPLWEAGDSSVGNAYFTLMGMHALNIGMVELFHDLVVLVRLKTKGLAYRFNLLYDLLKAKLNEPMVYPVRIINKVKEPIAELYRLFFEWKDDPNKDETIIGLIGDIAKFDADFAHQEDRLLEKWHELRGFYELKAETETLMDYIIAMNESH